MLSQTKPFISLFLLLPLLTGCAGTFYPKAGDTSADPIPVATAFAYSSQKIGAGDEELNIALHQDFLQATQYCRDYMNFYERRARYSNSTKMAIGALGGISGAILGPVGAAAGWGVAWTATFSGIAGMASTTLVSIDQNGLGADTYLQARMESQAKVEAAEALFRAAETNNARRLAVLAAYRCATPTITPSK
ncbi:MAG: hypothetical protein ACN6OP_00405 [Pseudomonadales bacterium]|jgi:hypothetical protein